MYKRIKKRTYEIIEVAMDGDILSRIIDIFLVSLIIVNVVLVIADTFDLPNSFRDIMDIIEIFSVVIFSAEYLVRVWTADLHFHGEHPARARIKYIP